MSRFRVAPACLRCVFAAALGLAPLLASGASAEKVKAALDAVEASVDSQNGVLMILRIAEIEAVLELTPERQTALHAAEQKALEEGRKAWRRRAEKSLRDPSVSDEQVEPGMFIEPDQDKDVLPAWKEALANVLTPEESKRVADRQEERKAQRTRNVAELFLLLVDERVALSTQQRARLLPIARQLVPKVQQMFPPDDEQDYEFANPMFVLSAAREASEKEVRAILVDAQWARWKKECLTPANQQEQFDGLMPGLPPAAGAGPPPLPAPAPDSASPARRESVGEELSSFMAAHAAHQRERLLGPLQLQIEEAARVADLSPAVCARLQIAARGTAERSLQQWAPQFQQYVQNNLEYFPAENLSQALSRLGNPDFLPPSGGPRKPSLFEKCLHAELTPAQLAACQKEVDARRDFRLQTIIHSILTGLDRVVPLRAEQFAKLSSMVAVMLADYREDLDAMGPPEQAAWYMQSEIRLMPLAGLAPAEVEAILGKPGWERWTKSEEYREARASWSNLKDNRQNRRR